MNELDKWAAEKCGVQIWVPDIITNGEWWKLPENSHWQPNEWSLSDARCMQVFREKFKISTIWDDEMFDPNTPFRWMCARTDSEGMACSYYGETIQEAELACAQAIFEEEYK